MKLFCGIQSLKCPYDLDEGLFIMISEVQDGIKYVYMYRTTVDGSEILHQLRLVVYPTIYKGLYIPDGCLGFLPSTVGPVRSQVFINFSGISILEWVNY